MSALRWASLVLLLVFGLAVMSSSTHAQTNNTAQHHVPPKKAKPAAKPPVVHPTGTAHPEKPPATVTPSPPVVAPAEVPKQPATDNSKGSATGLPLPRFVSLRFDDVNMRAGPGTRYPIEWLYKRRDLPVEILREFEVWRLVQDAEGIKGWVHQATLSGRRSFMITGGDATLRRNPEATSSPVAIFKVGVIGELRTCKAGSDWCQVQEGEYRGYLKRDQFWGALPGEVVGGG